MNNPIIGTCSWKYPSWKNLVYSGEKGINFLKEYSAKYDTVEIDQWFWSLFGESNVVLPKPETVREYADAIPNDFLFTIKTPNSITLTHLYPRYTKGRLVQNKHYLSIELLEEFLELLEPIHSNIGLIMFQFEYLNKQKMPSMNLFMEQLSDFFDRAPAGYSYALEPRNPQIFTKDYFEFIRERELSQVFIQGYYMPDITGIYRDHRDLISGSVVIRLHGYTRNEIEKKTGKIYNQIVAPMDEELPGVIEMIQDLRSQGIQVYLNVNNHYEGSAPLSIEKIKQLLDAGT